MLNANVSKHVNKKFVIHEEVVSAPRTLPQLPRVVPQPELPEHEERVEEMIQMSGNVVANIQDITLKESTLPDVQLLVNDNFGERQPEQPLQLLADRTMELMLAQDQSAAQHSLELDLPADKSNDKSRLVAPDVHMERISEHDLTLFNKSHGDELQIADITKEFPGIPDLPEIPPPAMPDPQPEVEKEKQMDTEQEIAQAPVEERQKETQEVVLEELEDPQPPAKKRRMKTKIIDKNIKLSSNYLRARIANCAVELRCEDAGEDIVVIRVPPHYLLGRAAHAGHRVRSALGHTITRLFLRNLGPVNKHPLADREMEQILSPRRGHLEGSHIAPQRSVLEKIDEEVEPALVVEPQQMDPGPAPELSVPEVMVPEVIVPEVIVPEVVVPEAVQEDIAELATQVIETLSQQRKRTAEPDIGGTPKAPRRSGYKSFRRSQGQLINSINVEEPDYEINKENISDNIPQEFRQSASGDRDLVTLLSMLQEAGLEDAPPRAEPDPVSPRAAARARKSKSGSESTETPLGSLDRTKVSLGDSERTTDSMRFIRDNWGTRGTMIKIIKCIKEGTRPLDMRTLMAQGPIVARKNIIAARCFTSILKLKHHSFIKVQKDPETLEILDINLGAKFETQ